MARNPQIVVSVHIDGNQEGPPVSYCVVKPLVVGQVVSVEAAKAAAEAAAIASSKYGQAE